MLMKGCSTEASCSVMIIQLFGKSFSTSRVFYFRKQFNDYQTVWYLISFTLLFYKLKLGT